MRTPLLTFIFAFAAPVSLASMACFLSTEGDGYDYDSYGTGGGCEVGTEGCPCTSGGNCNPGYYCAPNENICLLDTCPVGSEGCACTGMGACDPGLVCLSDFCVAQCTPGTEACPCTPGGGCDPGLACLSDTCVDPDGDDDDDDDDVVDEGSSGDDESTGDESTGGSTDGGDTTAGNQCGMCSAPPACPLEGDPCQCDCEQSCDGDDIVLCPNGAGGCQEVHNCANGCTMSDDTPICNP